MQLLIRFNPEALATSKLQRKPDKRQPAERESRIALVELLKAVHFAIEKITHAQRQDSARGKNAVVDRKIGDPEPLIHVEGVATDTDLEPTRLSDIGRSNLQCQLLGREKRQPDRQESRVEADNTLVPGQLFGAGAFIAILLYPRGRRTNLKGGSVPVCWQS